MGATHSEPESNFLQLVAVIFGPAQSAVRCFFDSCFPPSELNTQLTSVLKKRIERLRKEKVITHMEWDLLYPACGDAKSSCFDIHLMITLLRHFEIKKHQLPACGFDVLPPDQDQKPADDLARMKYYRNNIVHSATGTCSNDDFTVAWTHLYGAISRLGDATLKRQCDTLKFTGLYLQTKSMYEKIFQILKDVLKMKMIITNITIEQAKANEKIKLNLNNLQQRLELFIKKKSIQRSVPKNIRDFDPCNEENNSISTEGQPATKRRKTNHLARRFMLQKLDDKGVKHNHIEQISGHNNIQSVSNYFKLNSKKQRKITASFLNTDDDREQLDDNRDLVYVSVPHVPVKVNQPQPAAEYWITQTQKRFVPFSYIHYHPQARMMRITRKEIEMRETTRSISSSSGTCASFLFGYPIYDGIVNVAINKNI